MVIAAIGATTAQPSYPTPLRALASETVRPKGAQTPVASPATLVIERAPRLSFVYTKIDPSTGEEFCRWPTQPSREQATSVHVSAIVQLADLIA